jgi:hypothetical protein
MLKGTTPFPLLAASQEPGGDLLDRALSSLTRLRITLCTADVSSTQEQILCNARGAAARLSIAPTNNAWWQMSKSNFRARIG